MANFGVEVSTKASKAYERVQSRWLGLDGLRHVIQPYANYSLVENFGPSPEEIFSSIVSFLQPSFSRCHFHNSPPLIRSTLGIFSRLGVRNRLQTRREQGTHQWMTLDTFMDVNFENPYSDADVSNLFNVYRLRPVPWFTLTVASQLPITEQGFYGVQYRV